MHFFRICGQLNVRIKKLQWTINIITDIFGSIDKTYNMRLSRLCGRGINKAVQKFKREPIIMASKK